MNYLAAPTPLDPAAVRRRVLVVEDDPESAEFVRHVLTRRGQFEVTHTADPEAALALAAAQSWDLVLTDLDLPGMSGLALLAAVRRLSPVLPVVLATAYPLAGELPGGEAPGGRAAADPPVPAPDAVLVKPVPADVLLATVIRLTAGRTTSSAPGGRPRRRLPGPDPLLANGDSPQRG